MSKVEWLIFTQNSYNTPHQFPVGNRPVVNDAVDLVLHGDGGQAGIKLLCREERLQVEEGRLRVAGGLVWADRGRN